MLFSDQGKGKRIVVWQIWKAKIQLPTSIPVDTDLLSPKPSKFKSLHELSSARLREMIWFVSICYCKYLKQIYFTWLWSIHGTTTRGNAIADWLEGWKYFPSKVTSPTGQSQEFYNIQVFTVSLVWLMLAGQVQHCLTFGETVLTWLE